DPVGRDDQQRPWPHLRLLVADLRPQPAALDEHQLLRRMAVLGYHDATAVDDTREHRLLARHGLAEDARDVLDGRELVPGRDLAHQETPVCMASRPRRIFSGVTGSVSMRTPIASWIALTMAGIGEF